MGRAHNAPHPCAVLLCDLPERLHQFKRAGFDGFAVPKARAVLHIKPIGGSVLAG